MNAREFKIRLRQALSQLPVFKPISSRQVSIRCPFCDDSQSDENATHFYIKLDVDNDTEPVLFNCFRASCNASGILTPTVLRNLRINDLQLNSSLVSYNKKAMKMVNKKLGLTDNVSILDIPKPNEDSLLNIAKRDYINNRMGLNLSFDELVGIRTIFNFPHFLKYNGIDKLTVSKDRAQILQDGYVGFLTTRNEFINFRNILDNKNRRYDKYSINTNLDNTRKFYTIPNEINLLTSKKITINIAEGIFDIIGIFYHLFDKEKYNMIYTAVCGSGYMNVLKYFIQMGAVGYVDINIFSDSNMPAKSYKNIVKELNPWVDNFNLFYNEIEKDGKSDYGVKASEIKIRQERI